MSLKQTERGSLMASGPNRFAGAQPSKAELEAWVAAGYSDEEVGVLVGERLNLPAATKQTVAYWRKKHGVVRQSTRRPNLNYDDLRPWKVSSRHSNTPIDHLLYDYGRMKHGVDLMPDAQRRLEDFLEILTRRNWVLDYVPTTLDGWVIRTRDPLVDDPDSIVRKP